MASILSLRLPAALLLLGLLCTALPAGAARAAADLVELDIAAFSLACHPKLKLALSQDQEEARTEFAYVIPPDVSALDVLDIKWGKTRRASIAIAQTSQAETSSGSEVLTIIGVGFEDEDPQRIEITAEQRSGVLSRMAIWPAGEGQDAPLVVVMSFTSGLDDATMAGFVLEAGGSGRVIDLAGARTLYGWFEVEDAGGPDDGYELITRRNLDGTLGGFHYRAVRRYDAGLAAFVAEPDEYKDFFREELRFMDWIVSTATAVQQRPDKYKSKEDAGPQYVAEFEGEIFGFDMLLELPESYQSGGPGDRPGPSAADLNKSARQALAYISAYRDELKAWLDGGARPATWRMQR
ncbi:hypothetical protein IT575_08675 [bacterium]|nr:hypothetical protein [bacterium]